MSACCRAIGSSTGAGGDGSRAAATRVDRGSATDPSAGIRKDEIKDEEHAVRRDSRRIWHSSRPSL